MEYLVYVKPNESGHITAVNSSGFLTDTAGWVQIDSGCGDKYHHAQGNYFPLCIITGGGACRYKLVDGKAAECSAGEIAAQETAIAVPEAPDLWDELDAAYTEGVDSL